LHLLGAVSFWRPFVVELVGWDALGHDGGCMEELYITT